MNRSWILVFVILVLTFGAVPGVYAQTTEFTYQGKLTVSGAAANGQFDMQFRLFDAETGGTDVSGIPREIDNVQVTAGIFTVVLNFGQSFPLTETRWLQIEVRPGDSTGVYTLLSPRQKMTAAPFAVTALLAQTANLANDSAAVGGFTADQLIKEGDVRLTDARQPLAGSPSYVQISPGTPQSGGFDVAGNGKIGGSLTVSGAALLNSNLNVGGKIAGNGSGLTNVLGTVKWSVITSNQQAESNNGYLVNSPTELIVNLPAGPKVGDIVRIGRVGMGSWRISQNDGQSIIMNSLDLPWTARESSRLWSSVASSADGNKLVAVVQNGQIYTSTDSGLTWTARESSRNWQSVASSAVGNKLVAVVQNGQIYTSEDSGVTWTPRERIRNWSSVASSADGNNLVAVVQNGQIYTSTDKGVTWTARESNRNWQSVASSADGTKLVAVVNGGGIYTSTDSGVTWTARESNRPWQSVASSADGLKLVAGVFNGRIYTSTDSGVTWTQRESSRIWLSVASSADGTKLIAGADGQIYTSTDSGVTWIPRESNRLWASVASSADGTKLVAVVQNGQIFTSTFFTITGTAGGLIGIDDSTVELIYLGGGQFYILSSRGSIIFP